MSEGKDLMMRPNLPQTKTGGSLVATEQARAISEVQAALVVARANPRDELLAEKKVLNACKRKKLAEQALYSYPRGGKLVTGPSIRLAEVLARCWQNCFYGFREVGRGDDFSEVQAFCYDLEANVKVVREFQVKHLRDKKSGAQKLTSERDKYEYVANMAQRRVRACILEIIPGDIVDAAVEACEATLKQSIGDIRKQIDKIKKAFEQLGVTEEMLEAYLQRPLKSLVPADVVNLRKIHNSIRDGIGKVEDFFKKETQANKGPVVDGKPKKDNPKKEDKKEKQETPEKPPRQPQRKKTEEDVPPPPPPEGEVEPEYIPPPSDDDLELELDI